MKQAERRRRLIDALLAEDPRYREITIPPEAQEQDTLLRSLMNVRPPKPLGTDLLQLQDTYLSVQQAQKGIVESDLLPPLRDDPQLFLWQGDITTLRVDAIVNAANSGMTGCYVPCHNCIDNCIHSAAGIQLRLACAELMAQQGHPEETGQAKITPAYNLPCRYVLHTVGPIIQKRLTRQDEALLASCYRSCLALAEQYGLRRIAFCCISTGEFRFPNERAAEIAVETVKTYQKQQHSDLEVIFNVFKDKDAALYRSLLGPDRNPSPTP